MRERLPDRIKREWHELRLKMLKLRIRKAVEKMDKLQGFAFMAYSWGRDEVTDYHILAERSYADKHIYGTEVTRYAND